MGISALISLISRKIQRSMPERACPSSSGGCLRDAPALRELGTRQERDVELGSGAARLHRELPRGSRGARARLTPLCSRAPLLLPTPPARRHAAARLQLHAGGSTQPQPTARVLPAVAAALQRHLGQEASCRGTQAALQVNSCKMFCFDSALCLCAPPPPPEECQRWGGSEQQRRSALRHPWAQRNKTTGLS